jgi:hypothetical protein
MKRDQRRFARFGPREAALILIVLMRESLLGWINLVMSRIAASEYLLFLKFRNRLDPTRFRNGKGYLVASMPRF